MTLITDGLPAYHDAYKKEFWTLRNPRTEHVNLQPLDTCLGLVKSRKLPRFFFDDENPDVTRTAFKSDDLTKTYKTIHDSEQKTSAEKQTVKPNHEKNTNIKREKWE